jgi:hypothetical protein
VTAETKGTPEPESRVAAQRRADRVLAFRAELAALESEGVVALGPEARARVDAHHDALLARLGERFEVDVTEGEKGLSRGMRIAAFLGALALAASAVLFFYRIWGLVPTAAQVAILVAAPLLALGATELAARRERSGYFATLAGLVAFAAFVLDVSALGQVFDVTPSEAYLLAWAAFGLLLAYAYGLRLLLAAGILAFVGWLAAETGAWSGCHWLHFGERPENFLPAGVLLAAFPSLAAHRRLADFPPLYRAFGLLAILLPVLVLANWGETSYLPWAGGTLEAVYQVLGFALSAGAIWLGLRRRWPEAVNTGTAFFVVFTWVKLIDWFWDWMPGYLFFLIVGATAVAALLILKRLRAAAAASPGGGGR